MDSPAHAYLRQLRFELRYNPLLARRVVKEASDHLEEIVAEERRNGMSQEEAEDSAVRRFGPPGPLAREFDGFSMPLKVLVRLASLTTILVACWLFMVITLVLPKHDPTRVPMWTGAAIGFLTYSGLCLAYLVLGPRVRLLRFVVLTLSVAATGLGGLVVVQTLTADGRHFEGYLLLMGLILAGHGIIAFVYTAISAAIARRIVAH